jgi:hypothetical protein
MLRQVPAPVSFRSAPPGELAFEVLDTQDVAAVLQQTRVKQPAHHGQ